MDKAVDAAGANVIVPLWNDYAKQFRDISRFLQYAYCAQTVPQQTVYEPSSVVNPHSRPTSTPNLWVSAPSTFSQPEWLDFAWEQPQLIESVQILFDSSLHFHFWQSWQGYPARAIPSLVKNYRIVARSQDGNEHTVAEVSDNYYRNCRHEVQLVDVVGVRLEIFGTNGIDRAQVYSVRIIQ